MLVPRTSRPFLPALVCAALLAPAASTAQLLRGSGHFTRADTLRGTIGPERAWWDVLHYDVSIRPDFATKSISGTTIIGFIATDNGLRMQIDLQQPLVVDSVTADVSKFRNGGFTIVDQPANTEREGNVLWVDLPGPLKAGEASTIRITYHGVPREAIRPPWDGGWVWRTDKSGNPWMSVACQGLGASAWYPCKDHQGDEPDDGAALHITVPDSLQAIGNGRSRGVVKNNDGTSTWHWKVTNPINTYNLIPTIGKYTHFGEQLAGSQGVLDCDYWVLAYNEEKAREQFKQVAPTLACFEEWLGPYPFYKDGYKLVESPYLGMEHQSAIAYGNGYRNGHIGSDRSGTGWGLKFDYVIIHETAHEWFGNSITTADMADMWVHEGFADYSEALYIECQWGAPAATDYVVGLRKSIANDKPLIGPYGVNEEGSGDMYNKGSNLIHMIRRIIGDSTFKAMMLEMNKRFYHKVTTSAEVEDFMINFNDITKTLLDHTIFDQYLRTTQIPVVEYAIKKGQLWIHWTNCVEGFHMPVKLIVNGGNGYWNFLPKWQPSKGEYAGGTTVEVDRNWYVQVRAASKSDTKKLTPLPKGSIPLDY